MASKIESIEHNGEKIYLKKDWLGWRVVEPFILRDKETGKFDWQTWNWKNFCNKKNFVILGYFMILLIFLYLAYNEQINNYRQVISNPCAYCTSCQEYAKDFANSLKTGKVDINISHFFPAK